MTIKAKALPLPKPKRETYVRPRCACTECGADMGPPIFDCTEGICGKCSPEWRKRHPDAIIRTDEEVGATPERLLALGERNLI